MKKIISVLLGFLIFFVSPFIVSAKTVTPNELVEHTKNGDLYKMFTEVEGVKWDITYDEATKKIRSKYNYKPDAGDEINVDFYISYKEEGNYIEYVATSSDKEVTLTEQVYLGFIIYSLGDMYGYTNADINALIKSDEIDDYTLEAEGIYMEYEDVKDYVMSDGTKTSGRMIKKIQVSLEDGFGNLEAKPNSSTNSSTNSEPGVSNPKTTDMNVFTIVSSIILCVGLIIIGKKKLRKN